MAISLWETLCIYPTLSIHAVPRNGFCRFHRSLTACAMVKTVRPLIHRTNLDRGCRKNRRKPSENREKTVFAGDFAASDMGIRNAPNSVFSDARILPPMAPATYSGH
jgi:hypothetical protein